MSTWTHVAGVIRIDSVVPFSPSVFEETLGRILTWESSPILWKEFEKCPEKFTPTGSEGGIQYAVWENSNKSCLAKYTVSIFGDLRDYTNIKEIEDWFNNILYTKKFYIRDAILHITCDCMEEKTVKYDYDRAIQEWEKRHKDDE